MANMSFRLEHPYRGEGHWYKGNLHTHTTLSDGDLSPEAMIGEYEQRGYHFLGLSDHDLRLPVEDYQDKTKLVLLGATEVSGGSHILSVGVPSALPIEHDRQRVIDRTNQAGGIAILNHPNWGPNFSHWSHDLLEKLEGYAGIEIYNGVIERLEGSSFALDRWDRLLTGGKHVWGYSNDDAHRFQDIGRGWNVVWAASKNADSILQALKSGSFYASIGVSIDSIRIEDNVIEIDSHNAQRIRFVGRWGQELATIDLSEARYEAEGDESYIRVECYGMAGRVAWTQPIFVVSE